MKTFLFCIRNESHSMEFSDPNDSELIKRLLIELDNPLAFGKQHSMEESRIIRLKIYSLII